MIVYFIIFLIVVMSIAFILYSNKIEANNIKIQHITVKTDKIKSSFLIMQVSDFHLFANMSKTRLINIKNKIQEIIKQKIPDLVFLTGDFIDNNSGIDLLPDVLNLFKSKYGIYAVFGNHDYFQYNVLHIFSPVFFMNEKKATDLPKLKEVLNSAGIELLIDEIIDVRINENTLDLIGIDSLSILKKKLHKIEIKDNERFKIVLSHYPDAIKYLRGKVDILFSGHTHGGQVTIFGIPITAKSKIKKNQAKGASIHEDTILFISKGVGVSHYFPFRFFANPDISLITIEESKYE